MRLWKILLIAATTAILPLALVSVGYAQELNCWGLRPVRTNEVEPCEHSLSTLSSHRSRSEKISGQECLGNKELDDS